ncbi:hypothetical protein KBI87_09375, partial [Campylobacter coli]|uniref:hypothetical protein n=1 Tax=Campylobacter coli TaxID=195 RepID=UPI001EDB0483
SLNLFIKSMILLLSVSFNPTLLISLSNVISLLSKQVFIREIQYLGSILDIIKDCIVKILDKKLER